MPIAKYLQGIKDDPRAVGALSSLIQAESSGNPNAVSPKGAVGLTQLMPGTARDLGVNPLDPTQAKAGATKYLSYLLKETGNLSDSLAAYNTGLGNWKKNRGNLPKETGDYVKRVMGLLAKHEQGLPPPTVASAPVNPQDPASQSSEKKDDAPPQQATSLASGPGTSPQFQGYGKISNPPSQFMGKDNPIAMVQALLQDPTSLSRGEGRANMAGGGLVRGVFKDLAEKTRAYHGSPGSMVGSRLDPLTVHFKNEGSDFVRAPDQYLGPHFAQNIELAEKFARGDVGGKSTGSLGTVYPADIHGRVKEIPTDVYTDFEAIAKELGDQASLKFFRNWSGKARPDISEKDINLIYKTLKKGVPVSSEFTNSLDQVPASVGEFMLNPGYGLPIPDLSREETRILVSNYRNKMKKEGIGALQYKNTAPFETGGVPDTTSFVAHPEAVTYLQGLTGYAGGGLVKKMLSLSKNFAKNDISPEEMEALWRYQGPAYVNSVLRGLNNSATYNKSLHGTGNLDLAVEDINKIDELFKRAPKVEEPITTLRMSRKGAYPTTKEPAYLSTTPSPRAIRGMFPENSATSGDLHKIQVPEGTPFLMPFLNDDPRHFENAFEKELILPRGGRLARGSEGALGYSLPSPDEKDILSDPEALRAQLDKLRGRSYAGGGLVKTYANKLFESLIKRGGEREIPRAERLLKELPEASMAHDPETLSRALRVHPSVGVVEPGSFEKFASPIIPDDTLEKRLQKLRDLRASGTPFNGDLPFLELSPTSPDNFEKFRVLDHEGRHRNRVLSEKGTPSLVSLFSETAMEDLDPGELSALKIGNPQIIPQTPTDYELEQFKAQYPDLYRKYKSTFNRDGAPLSSVVRSRYAEGGAVIRNAPRNKILGALSDLVNGADEHVLKPAQEYAAKAPGVNEALTAGLGLPLVYQYLTGDKPKPLSWLVPRLNSLGGVLEDASYGMPLTTGKGMTTGLKPEVGFAALDAAQLPSMGRGAASIGRGIKPLAAKMLPKRAAPDVMESMFGPEAEWKEAKKAWDSAQGFAGGGAVKGALTKLRSLVGGYGQREAEDRLYQLANEDPELIKRALLVDRPPKDITLYHGSEEPEIKFRKPVSGPVSHFGIGGGGELDIPGFYTLREKNIILNSDFGQPGNYLHSFSGNQRDFPSISGKNLKSATGSDHPLDDSDSNYLQDAIRLAVQNSGGSGISRPVRGFGTGAQQEIPRLEHIALDPEKVLQRLGVKRISDKGYAGGGAVRGALGRIAKMLGGDEVPAKLLPLQAVKEQGGQWLPGRASDFLLENNPRLTPSGKDIFGKSISLEPHEEWARKAVPKYIEKYMGAKGDPLADVMIPQGQGTRRWEEATDPLVYTLSRRQFTDKELPDWAQKLPPETLLHGIGGNSTTGNHVAVQGYISHVLDHAATIPTEKLQQYDFPRLVKEVQKVDADRAKRMAQSRLAESGLVPTHKEYPGGFKWSELKAPEGGLTPAHMERIKKQLSGEFHAVDADGKLIFSSAQPSTRAVGKTPEEAFTAGRLIEEGNIMGHCVGDYCQDVMGGRKKIYSLRDSKGESHATVEVSQDIPSAKDVEEYLRSGKVGERAFPTQINQIKGKQNFAPKPEYQQYIQDFIRSGKYGDVRDLQNSGLQKLGFGMQYKKGDRYETLMPEASKVLKEKYGDYVTQGEIDDYLKSIQPGIPQMKRGGAVKKAWDSAQGFAGGGAVKGALGRIAKMLGGDEVPAKLLPLQAVKEQGGQWLPGSAKEFVQGPTPWPDHLKKPHEEWAEKAIPKYIERYMGAKGDPLADVMIPYGQEMKRWEEATDPLIRSKTAEMARHPQHFYEGKPKVIPDWINKLDAETPVHYMTAYKAEPIKNYVSHVLDHAATIPPEKLQQYDFPRLVKEVQKVDADRAKRMAQSRLAEQGLVPTHKEYPSGFRWSELKSPEGGLTPAHMERIKQQPSGEYHAVDADGKLIFSSAQPSTRAVGKTPEEAFTAGRLIEEGNIMGHCVGGYCPDVMGGRKKIYSLRDPKGESHATVQVNPSFASLQKLSSEDVSSLPSRLQSLVAENPEKNYYWDPKSPNASLVSEDKAEMVMHPKIAQIKGKQNLAPKPEYQQYIQDLIRSGKWGDVMDLKNSGLTKVDDAYASIFDKGAAGVAQREALKAKHGDYVTGQEIEDYMKTTAPGIPQMKKGGVVKKVCKGWVTCPCIKCTRKRFEKRA